MADGHPRISDLLPVRGWLLLAIAAVAFKPAQYVWRYVAHAPSRRDITQPQDDLSWRTPDLLRRNLFLLLGSLAFAAFIFTPLAEQWARSPSFWPILIGAIGAWSISTVIRALDSGQIEPLIRGVSQSFEREAQPKRFWASMAWNTLIGALMLWLALTSDDRSSRCFDTRTPDAAKTAVDACSALLADAKSDNERADLFAARGVAYHTMNDYSQALDDYAAAVHLDHRDDSSHYNRGLIFQDLADVWNAAAEYDAALRINPENKDARERRAKVEETLERQRASVAASNSRP